MTSGEGGTRCISLTCRGPRVMRRGLGLDPTTLEALDEDVVDAFDPRARAGPRRRVWWRAGRSERRASRRPGEERGACTQGGEAAGGPAARAARVPGPVLHGAGQGQAGA